MAVSGYHGGTFRIPDARGLLPMHVRLTVFHDKSRVREVVLRRDTIIGRARDCNLRIPVEDVSRHHCQIRLTETEVFLKDLESANGTLLDGQPIPTDTDVQLPSGSDITVGPVRFLVQVNHDDTPLPEDNEPALDETTEFPVVEDELDSVSMEPSSIHGDHAVETGPVTEDSAIELELVAEQDDEEFPEDAPPDVPQPHKSRSLFDLFRRSGRQNSAEVAVDEDELVEPPIDHSEEEPVEKVTPENDVVITDADNGSGVVVDNEALTESVIREDVVVEAEDSVVFDFLPADDIVTDDLDEDDLSTFLEQLE